MALTVEDLTSAARRVEGQTLKTIGGRATFKVKVRNDGIPIFTPTSTGYDRNATNQKYLQQIVAIYNRTGSLTLTDYREVGSRNLSYILRLVALASGRS